MAIKKLLWLPATPTRETAEPIPPVQPGAIMCLPGHDPAVRGLQLAKEGASRGVCNWGVKQAKTRSNQGANLRFQFGVERLLLNMFFFGFIFFV